MSLVERKMSKSVDVSRLIAEVYKRPALWDCYHEHHRKHKRVAKLWEEVSQNLGVVVRLCKRKWTNLRDAYRAEKRRTERRIEKDKLMGTFHPNTNYNSKWTHFSALYFIRDLKPISSHSTENENSNSNSTESGNDFDEGYKESICGETRHTVFKNMSEFNHLDDDLKEVDEPLQDEDDVMILEELQAIATPLSSKLPMNSKPQQNSGFTLTNAKPSTTKAPSCKRPKSPYDQLHFLQDFGKKEQILVNSTRQAISRYNTLEHLGDSDYNFLISFLPQVKKMSELQNLQFRAKMCDLVLYIMAPTATGVS